MRDTAYTCHATAFPSSNPIRKQHNIMQNRFNVTTLHVNTETEKRNEAEEEANARRFVEESIRLQEIEKRKNEEERALQEANAKRDAVELAKKMRFMQPHNAAYDIYERSNKQIPVYWLDSHGNFYQCPSQPYNKPNPIEQERPYIWKRKMVDKIVTYKDDPVTLAKGEWEYRRVSVEYKSYL